MKVKVVDKPIDLAATDLNLTLAFSPEPEMYGELLAEASALLADSFFPSSEPEGTTLLDAMVRALDAPSGAAFTQQRELMDWDTAVQDHLDASGTSLREAALAWTTAGLSLQSENGSPEIVANLTAVGESPGHALLRVKSFGNIDAALAGIPGDHLMSWTADPKDNVALDGSIFWLPTRYLAAVAFFGAQLAQPGIPTVHEALVGVAGCYDLAISLGAIPTCDTDCLTQLCVDALAARWDAGVRASARTQQVGELTITAGGLAKVGDTARPLRFDGTWIGLIIAGGATASVEGAVHAVATQPDDPPQ